MYRIRKLYRKCFYPEKKIRSLILHFSFTLLMIGLLLMSRIFIDRYTSRKYEMMPENMLYETDCGEWDIESFQSEDIEESWKTRGQSLSDLLKNPLVDVVPCYMVSSFSVRSSQGKYNSSINVFFSTELAAYRGFGRKSVFEVVQRFSETGIYIDETFAEQLGIGSNRPRLSFTISNHLGASAPAPVSVEIAGIYAHTSENKQDIYATFDVMETLFEVNPNAKISGECLYRFKNAVSYASYLKANQINSNLTAKAKDVQYDKALFGNVYTVSEVYIGVGIAVMGFALIVIAVDLESGNRKIRKLEKTFYRSEGRIVIAVGGRLTVPLLFGAIATFGILFLFGVLAKPIFGYYLFLRGSFYLFALAGGAIVVLVSMLTSWLGLKK